jgi:hypothetical protein
MCACCLCPAGSHNAVSLVVTSLVSRYKVSKLERPEVFAQRMLQCHPRPPPLLVEKRVRYTGSGTQGQVHRVRCTGSGTQGQVHRVRYTGSGTQTACRVGSSPHLAQALCLSQSDNGSTASSGMAVVVGMQQLTDWLAD